jgi:homoserine dehydrogenase
MDLVEADVLVECTPSNFESGEPGLQNILASFKHKLHVVSVNKGPLALALPMLLELADFNGVQLKFGGSVGGGTPVLNFVRKCLRGDKIESVRGVLNGTCNYVLTRMEEDGIQLNEAVAQAQQEGLAEADPSLDLKGVDAAAKLVILSNLALNTRAVLKDVERTGIDEITLDQIERAKQRKKLIRLIASANGGLRVAPEQVDRNDPLAVKGSINAVTFKSLTAGEETVMGKGAGGVETASAIIRDLIDIKDNLLAS